MNTFTKIVIAAGAIGLPLAAHATTQPSDHDMDASQASHAPKPAISKAQARKIALGVAPGKVAAAEYEKEDGAWRWSFDIRQNGKIHEVGVNAMTGKVVENSWEHAGSND